MNVAEPFLMDRLLGPGGIRPVMQPLYDLSRGTPVPWAVECLSRGPAGSAAEPANLLFEYVRFRKREADVDKICIQTALRAASALRGDVRVNLNVHASTVARNPSFAPWLLRQAFDTGIAPSRLVLELVEHVPTPESDGLIRTLAHLRGAGVKIAVDDVGMGMSTLRLIVEVAPDLIKIDRFFIAGANSDPRKRAVISSMVELARNIGAAVVALGSESPNQLALVFSLGVRLVQGFGLCEPLPVDELAGRVPELFEQAQRAQSA